MDEYFQLGIVNQMANKIPKAKNSFIINSQRSTCCFVFFPYSSEPAISTKSLLKSWKKKRWKRPKLCWFASFPILSFFFFTHVAHGDNRHTPRRRSNSEIGKSRSKFWLSKKKLYKQIRTAAAIVLAFSISAVVQFRCRQQLPCMFGPFFSFSILFSIYTYIILYIQPYRASSLTTSVGRCRTTKSSGEWERNSRIKVERSGDKSEW
jgi:hypothetical protein